MQVGWLEGAEDWPRKHPSTRTISPRYTSMNHPPTPSITRGRRARTPGYRGQAACRRVHAVVRRHHRISHVDGSWPCCVFRNSKHGEFVITDPRDPIPVGRPGSHSETGKAGLCSFALSRDDDSRITLPTTEIDEALIRRPCQPIGLLWVPQRRIHEVVWWERRTRVFWRESK